MTMLLSHSVVKLVGLKPLLFKSPRFYRPIATNASSNSSSKENKASLDQLTQLENILLEVAPTFFKKPHTLDIYTNDVVLIDNIRNIKAQGLHRYALQINLIKIYHYMRYTMLKLELLNLVKHPEESCLKLRWRIVAKPGLIKLIFYFWKYPIPDIWKDGISTFYVNQNGKIYQHVCDNIDVDPDIKAKGTKTIKRALIDRGISV